MASQLAPKEDSQPEKSLERNVADEEGQDRMPPEKRRVRWIDTIHRQLHQYQTTHGYGVGLVAMQIAATVDGNTRKTR